MYKVTLIGGGTGSYTILTGLKNYPDLDIAAIVAMTDDGGSTGVLRDELGALPPGDTRQCLVALSESAKIWRQLFNFRFAEGRLRGQNFGNLFITALQQITGDFEKSLALAADLLQANGQVIPVTLDDVRLIAMTDDGQKIIGESNIDLKDTQVSKILFQPEPSPNPKAIARILNSDLLVICPGDIYTSILPNILVRSMGSAFRDSRALKVYICNIMTQPFHTQGFKVIDFINILEQYLGKDIFDFVVYNTQKPDEAFLQSYLSEGEFFVEYDEKELTGRKTVFLGREILSQKIPQKVEGDLLKRALIRHDPIETAAILYSLLVANSKKEH
ncbi:uridine diphosphate-N-acetylglucosamine-binding protein YvcK [Patescibacteria group bacterium]